MTRSQLESFEDGVERDVDYRAGAWTQTHAFPQDRKEGRCRDSEIVDSRKQTRGAVEAFFVSEDSQSLRSGSKDFDDRTHLRNARPIAHVPRDGTRLPRRRYRKHDAQHQHHAAELLEHHSTLG